MNLEEIKRICEVMPKLLAVVEAAKWLFDNYESFDEPAAYIYRARLNPLFEAMKGLDK